MKSFLITLLFFAVNGVFADVVLQSVEVNDDGEYVLHYDLSNFSLGEIDHNKYNFVVDGAVIYAQATTTQGFNLTANADFIEESGILELTIHNVNGTPREFLTSGNVHPIHLGVFYRKPAGNLIRTYFLDEVNVQEMMSSQVGYQRILFPPYDEFFVQIIHLLKTGRLPE